MSWRDPAALPLRPLIDLVADPGTAPSIVAEAALFCAAQDDPCGWLPVHTPPPGLRATMHRAGLIPDRPPELPPAARNAEGLLWSARLMRQLGARDQVAELLGRIDDDAPLPILAWRDLLLAELGRGALPAVPAEGAGLPVRFAVALARAESEPPDNALFEEAQALAAEAGADSEAARTRVQAARLRRLRGGPVPTLAVDSGRDDFLVRDARVALLHAAARDATTRRDGPAARGHAEAALALDPTGAATWLLVATVTRALGDLDAARAHYRGAARLGLAERTGALTALIDLAGGDGGELVGALADLLAHDRGDERDRLRAVADRRAALAGTAGADVARWAGTAGRTGHPRPLPLERYRPFLDLRPSDRLDPVDVPPVAVHTPLMSYEALRDGHEPWFREIHPQRATAAMFRAEMQATAAVHGYESGATSAAFETWRTAPDGCPPDVRERLAHAADLPLLERALLGRLLSAVGFHAEAKEILPGPEVPALGPEGAYALASWLFAEQMLTTGHAAELDPHFRVLYGQLGDDARYARLKVVTAINATVNAARRREPETIAYWRRLGEPDLAAYTGLAEVGAFDAAVMTSRWYRAMGFLPFLTGDKDLLRSDMDRWLGIAGDLTGHDERTRVIAADNYFPAVETAIRSHVYLGEPDIALSMVEKLAAEIDPIDPKTWLTAGELRHQSGDVAGALEAYLRAAHLQFPYGRISWFNAGQCHEALGQADLAADCYRRSLAHWPTGVTPLRRLRDLHLRGLLGGGGDVLGAWAAGQPAWSRLPAFEQ